MSDNLSAIRLRDVTLRDGLQLTGTPLDSARKVELIRALIAVGVPSIEIGSMARPDLVPALADTIDVVKQLTEDELRRCWVWVATPRHVERAAAAGVRNFQYCLSASDAHGRANIGRTAEESLAAMPSAVEQADKVGGSVQLCIATAFTCPFEGAVPIDRVLSIIRDPRAAGARQVVVCDTLGQAVPQQVGALVRRVREMDSREILFHGHDTWGLGVANSLAAVSAGAAEVDGALGGLGGCPFAPGAGGNTATEDLVFALRPAWLDTAAFRRLVELSESVLEELGEPNRSRASQGARASTTTFEWALGARSL